MFFFRKISCFALLYAFLPCSFGMLSVQQVSSSISISSKIVDYQEKFEKRTKFQNNREEIFSTTTGSYVSPYTFGVPFSQKPNPEAVYDCDSAFSVLQDPCKEWCESLGDSNNCDAQQPLQSEYWGTPYADGSPPPGIGINGQFDCINRFIYQTCSTTCYQYDDLNTQVPCFVDDPFSVKTGAVPMTTTSSTPSPMTSLPQTTIQMPTSEEFTDDLESTVFSMLPTTTDISFLPITTTAEAIPITSSHIDFSTKNILLPTIATGSDIIQSSRKAESTGSFGTSGSIATTSFPTTSFPTTSFPTSGFPTTSFPTSGFPTTSFPTTSFITIVGSSSSSIVMTELTESPPSNLVMIVSCSAAGAVLLAAGAAGLYVQHQQRIKKGPLPKGEDDQTMKPAHLGDEVQFEEEMVESSEIAHYSAYEDADLRAEDVSSGSRVSEWRRKLWSSFSSQQSPNNSPNFDDDQHHHVDDSFWPYEPGEEYNDIFEGNEDINLGV